LEVLVMRNHTCKTLSIGGLLFFSLASSAEGIVDIKPYASASISHDDNIFRFSSPEQAKAVLGSDDASDTVKQVDVGVAVNLRLSRQLVTAATSVNESTYSRFQNLNNTGNANSLRWSWRIGNDVYGELSTSKSEAIAGFNETRSQSKNLRTSSRQLASINWNLQPDWTLSANREHVKLDNALESSNVYDREDDIYESSIRYHNLSGTVLGLSYRVADSMYPNRTGFTQSIFGNESTQKDIIVSAAWVPTAKTRVTTRVSRVSLDRKDSSQRDFNGFSQRWNLDESLTSKTSVNLTAYQEVSPVEDVLSTYVKIKGWSINPIWDATDKIRVRSSFGHEARTYLGSAGISFNNIERYDESKLFNLSLTYAPTLRSLVQLQYQGEKRTSNTGNQGYQFNNLNLSLRYDY
jgi:exopolysaccharide biosynthesis operon protein EpsL